MTSSSTPPPARSTPWRSVLLFVAGLWALDRGVGYGLDAVGTRVVVDHRLADLAARRLDADWLVLGSSRAARDISAEALGAAAGARAFNLGVPGSDVGFHLEVARLIAERSGATGVVWVVDDPSEFSKDGLFFATDALVPALSDPRVREILVAHDELNPWFAAVSVSYRYRRWTDVLLKQAFKGGASRALAAVRADGSMPLTGRSITWDTLAPREVKPYDPATEDTDRIASFNAVLDTLAPRRVVIVLPPNLDPPTPGFADRVRGLAGDRAEVIDASGGSSPKEDFFDASHLTGDRAATFSRELGAQLRDSAR